MNRFISLFVIISIIPGCFIFEEKNKDELTREINKEIKRKRPVSVFAEKTNSKLISEINTEIEDRSPALGPPAELLSFASIKRLGAFRFPNIKNVDFAEGVIELNSSKNSIYLIGHVQTNPLFEFEIPRVLSSSTKLSKLTTAKLLQNYQYVLQRTTGGKSESIERIGGLKLITDTQGNKKLIGAGFKFYDAESSQTYSHFVVNDPDNLKSTSVGGYFAIQGPARKQGGYMIELSPKWQKIFGKTHLAGRSSGQPIISGLSVGPAAYAVNLDEVGKQPNPSTITLLEYGLKRTINRGGEADLNNESRTNDIWTHKSLISGGFISGDTLGFFGHSGGHNEGVSYKTAAKNSCSGNYGFEANNCDYDYYYWFYNLNDLKRVFDGDSWPHLLQPYEYGPFNLPFDRGRETLIGGVATDSRIGHVYITQLNSDTAFPYHSGPIVHVFNVSAVSTD